MDHSIALTAPRAGDGFAERNEEHAMGRGVTSHPGRPQPQPEPLPVKFDKQGPLKHSALQTKPFDSPSNLESWSKYGTCQKGPSQPPDTPPLSSKQTPW